LSTLRLDGGAVIHAANSAGIAAGSKATVSVRPEHLRVVDPGARAGHGLPAVMKVAMPLGASIVYECELPGGALVKVNQSRDGGLSEWRPDAQVWLSMTAAERAIVHALPTA
jgi:hypothetical protein